MDPMSSNEEPQSSYQSSTIDQQTQVSLKVAFVGVISIDLIGSWPPPTEISICLNVSCSEPRINCDVVVTFLLVCLSPVRVAYDALFISIEGSFTL